MTNQKLFLISQYNKSLLVLKYLNKYHLSSWGLQVIVKHRIQHQRYEILICKIVKVCQSLNACITRSISPRSVQLSPMGSEQGWGLLAGQPESRKVLCPNIEGLCAALKSAGKIHVQCFSKMYSSVSSCCDNQTLQSQLLGSKNDKKKY